MAKIALISLLLLLDIFTKSSGTEISKNEKADRLNAVESYVQLVLSKSNNRDLLPDPEVLAMGIKGYMLLLDEGKITNEKPLTVIDFSLPSTSKRIWIIDMSEGNILHHDYVSHGRNSGELMAETFSNTESSYMSSLGFYLTAETYSGKHGYSLRLDGLEDNFNDNARERAIVIHGADYAEETFAKQTGRLGRSLGCPALPQDSAPLVIDLIKDKSCIFIYGENQEYITKSKFLNT